MPEIDEIVGAEEQRSEPLSTRFLVIMSPSMICPGFLQTPEHLQQSEKQAAASVRLHDVTFSLL